MAEDTIKGVVQIGAWKGNRSKICVSIVPKTGTTFVQVFATRQEALIFATDMAHIRGWPIEDLKDYDH